MRNGLGRWSALGVGLALVWGAAAAQVSAAIRAKEPTPGELALLPEWCIDSQDGPYGSPEGPTGMNRSPRAAKWVAAMGTDFWHMHHYCRGLRDTLRLRRPALSPGERTFLMERAINEFEYVITNCLPSMPLMPEVLLKKGQIHLMRGDLEAASLTFERSRQLKPDYWPAYTMWVDALLELRQYDAARALIEEGLRQVPQSPQLLERQRRIAAGKRPASMGASSAEGGSSGKPP